MEKTYLMWVGSDNYKTIEEWVEEALVQGVSKRLPNANVGASLKEPGTVVFVAHDEGEWKECPDCLGTIENPEWRKMNERQEKLAEEIETFEKERDELTDSTRTEETEETKKRCVKLNRFISRREEKIKELDEEMAKIDEYIEGGTGGNVKVVRIDTGQPEEIDRRKFDYWHHQPKKFHRRYHLTENPAMCEACGGKGQLPEAKIFGLFIPSAVEYILKAEDSKTVEEEVAKKGFRPVPKKQLKVEMERKCGRRKEGGYYVVTDKDATKEKAAEIVEKLVSSGFVKPDGVDIKGEFVRFLAPVPVEVKRFRGIKRWEVEDGSDVEEEAEMIIDALE